MSDQKPESYVTVFLPDALAAGTYKIRSISANEYQAYGYPEGGTVVPPHVVIRDSAGSPVYAVEVERPVPTPAPEELVAFFKRVNPILHEPLVTKVAEEWARNFLNQFGGQS